MALEKTAAGRKDASSAQKPGKKNTMSTSLVGRPEIWAALVAVLLIGFGIYRIANKAQSAAQAPAASESSAAKQEPRPEVQEAKHPTGTAAGPVTALTDDLLLSFLEANPAGAMVNFYSPNCPHCREMAPEYESAAVQLQAAGGPAFASMDGTEAPMASKIYKIDRYPTVWFFKNGEAVLEVPSNPDARTAKALVDFAEKAADPPFVEFATRDELDTNLGVIRQTLAKGAPPIVVGVDRAGSSEVASALGYAGERLRGQTVFIYVPAGDASGFLRAYYATEAEDRIFEGALQGNNVKDWAEGLVAEAAAARKAEREERHTKERDEY